MSSNSELKISTTDYLALERTMLANERTFLAYFRTFIVLFSSGVAIIKLELLEEIKMVGFGLMIIAPVLMLIGLIRFFYVKRKLKKFYNPS